MLIKSKICAYIHTRTHTWAAREESAMGVSACWAYQLHWNESNAAEVCFDCNAHPVLQRTSVAHMCWTPCSVALALPCLLSYILARQTAQNENWNQKQMLTVLLISRQPHNTHTCRRALSRTHMYTQADEHSLTHAQHACKHTLVYSTLSREVSDARTPTRSQSLDIFTWRRERKSSQLTKTERTRRCERWQWQRQRQRH